MILNSLMKTKKTFLGRTKFSRKKSRPILLIEFFLMFTSSLLIVFLLNKIPAKVDISIFLSATYDQITTSVITFSIGLFNFVIILLVLLAIVLSLLLMIGSISRLSFVLSRRPSSSRTIFTDK